MLEIIRRREGERHQKEQITGLKVQISYNDFEHLAIRVIQPIPDPNDDSKALDCDILIVFDAFTTEKILDFCQKINNGRFSDKRLPF